jgi:hypothetical protein
VSRRDGAVATRTRARHIIVPPGAPPLTRLRFLLIGVLAFSLSNVASAQDRANRIRNLDAVFTVRSDGRVDVTEELTVQVAGESNEVVRDLALRDDGARKGPKMLDVQVLAVTDEDGQPLRTEEASADGGWARRLRIWIPGAANGDRRIAIRYRIAGAIHSVRATRNVGALDEMRWNVIGNGDMPIDSVHARVVLPAGARPTLTAVYTVRGDSATTDATTRKNGNEVGFTLARGLAPHQAITLSVSFPLGYIQRQPSLWARLVPVLSWWPLLIPLIVFVLAFRLWNKRGRDPKENSQVVRYEPVDGVSPAGLGKLVSNELEPPMRLFTATLVDLAIRGFLRIEETTPSILLTLNKDVGAIAQSMLHGNSGSVDYIIHFARPRSEWKGLKWHEVRLLDALTNAAPSTAGTAGDSVRVSMLSNKFYVSVPEIVEAMEFELVAKGYYHTRPGKVNLRWITYASFPLLVAAFVSWFFGGVLDMAWTWIFDEPPENNGWVPQSDNKFVFAMLLSTLILIGFAFIMPSRSVVGARAREAALGFKEFLSRVDTMPSVELFESYLPYAIAFGVQNTWARAFENIYVTPPSWYSGPMGKFSSTTFGHRISDLCISAASSMSSRPSELDSGLRPV